MAHYKAFNCANFDELEVAKEKKLAPSDHKYISKCAIDCTV